MTTCPSCSAALTVRSHSDSHETSAETAGPAQTAAVKARKNIVEIGTFFPLIKAPLIKSSEVRCGTPKLYGSYRKSFFHSTLAVRNLLAIHTGSYSPQRPTAAMPHPKVEKAGFNRRGTEYAEIFYFKLSPQRLGGELSAGFANSPGSCATAGKFNSGFRNSKKMIDLYHLFKKIFGSRRHNDANHVFEPSVQAG